MQMTMTLEACSRCGQPIAPGEPAMQTASVDLDIYGRAVSSPVRSYHLTGRCYEDAQGSRSCPQGGPGKPLRRLTSNRIPRGPVPLHSQDGLRGLAS